MNRARNADHAARTCERFVYSLVKITRLYDYQTWHTHCFEKFTRCAKVCGLFSLIVRFGCWLAEQANSSHVSNHHGVFFTVERGVLFARCHWILPPKRRTLKWTCCRTYRRPFHLVTWGTLMLIKTTCLMWTLILSQVRLHACAVGGVAANHLSGYILCWLELRSLFKVQHWEHPIIWALVFQVFHQSSFKVFKIFFYHRIPLSFYNIS